MEIYNHFSLLLSKKGGLTCVCVRVSPTVCVSVLFTLIS